MTRNHRHWGFGRLRWLGLLLLSLIAPIAFAGPAAAAETIQGSGAGVGHSTINQQGDPEFPLCLPGNATGSSYVIDIAEGTVTAAETMPEKAAVYAGPIQITITLTEDFYFSPAGIFEDSTCTVPDLVDATIEVNGANGSGSVNCQEDDGSFSRVNTTITFNEVLADGDGSCTVNSVISPGGLLTSVTVSPVTHAFAGNEYPCLEEPFTTVYTCPSPVDTVHVQGDWTVTGADLMN